MSELMVSRLEDHDPLSEAFEMPQPRAVGSPLPRGNGTRVPLPPNYDDLEGAPGTSTPGPVLAPPLNAVAVPLPGPVLAPQPVPAPQRSTASGRKTFDEQLAAAEQQRDSRKERPSLPDAPGGPQAAEPRTKAADTGAGGLQRALRMARAAMPIVQKLLPLVDRNFATAVSNLLAPHAEPAAVAPQQPAEAPVKVDLEPIRKSVADLQASHRDLREYVVEQNRGLKRVEDQLDMVREATDRNTLEQQELLEDLKAMGGKVNVVAAVAIGLLVVSLVVNLALFMHIQKVLP